MLTEGELRKLKRLQKRHASHLTVGTNAARPPLTREEIEDIGRALQALCLRRAHDHLCVQASEPLRASQLQHGEMLRSHRAGSPVLRWWSAFAGAIGEATAAADRDLWERLRSLGLYPDPDDGGVELDCSLFADAFVRGRYVYHAATDRIVHRFGPTIAALYPSLLLEPLRALAGTLPDHHDPQELSQVDNARLMAAYELCRAYAIEWRRDPRTRAIEVRLRQE